MRRADALKINISDPGFSFVFGEISDQFRHLDLAERLAGFDAIAFVHGEDAAAASRQNTCAIGAKGDTIGRPPR